MIPTFFYVPSQAEMDRKNGACNSTGMGLWLMKLIHSHILRQSPDCMRWCWAAQFVVAALGWSSPWLSAFGTESPVTTQFRQEIKPILKEYCYDCHGDGENKGKIAFDELKSDEAL